MQIQKWNSERGRGYSAKFYTVAIRPKVQILTILFTILTGEVIL